MCDSNVGRAKFLILVEEGNRDATVRLLWNFIFNNLSISVYISFKTAVLGVFQ